MLDRARRSCATLPLGEAGRAEVELSVDRHEPNLAHGDPHCPRLAELPPDRVVSTTVRFAALPPRSCRACGAALWEGAPSVWDRVVHRLDRARAAMDEAEAGPNLLAGSLSAAAAARHSREAGAGVEELLGVEVSLAHRRAAASLRDRALAQAGWLADRYHPWPAVPVAVSSWSGVLHHGRGPAAVVVSADMAACVDDQAKLVWVPEALAENHFDTGSSLPLRPVPAGLARARYAAEVFDGLWDADPDSAPPLWEAALRIAERR